MAHTNYKIFILLALQVFLANGRLVNTGGLYLVDELLNEIEQSNSVSAPPPYQEYAKVARYLVHRSRKFNNF